MGDGTKDNPYTRKDVVRLIEEHGGKADGLDLSGKVFEKGIDLSGFNHKDLNLLGIILRNAIMHGACLRNSYLEFAKLQNTFLPKADLQGADLTGAELQEADLWLAKLQGVRLVHTEFSQSTNFRDADWGNYILQEENEGLFAEAVSSYQRLRVWYRNAGISDTEGSFLYREMKCKRKQFWWGHRKPLLKDLIHPFQPKKALRAMFPRNPLWWILLTAYYLICGYGERLTNILVWVFGIIFGLAAVYYFWGSFSSSSFWDTLYYSVASFTALGYGQWAPQPTGWAKGMGAAEAIIGVFMMALFLVTFVRKMTR